jgi:hypothetical protein
MALPSNEIEYQSFIHAFETGTLSKEEWRHPEHVAMAFWYLTHFDEETATTKICAGIQNLNLKHRVQQTPNEGYHETWTIFFAKMLRRYIDQELDRKLSTIQQMECAIQYLKNFREMTRLYYSRDLIMSWEARISWREPDLRPI